MHAEFRRPRPAATMAAMHYAPLIKEIARGHRGSRALTRDDARQLFAAALDGSMPDAVLGAFVVALRMKGETVDELLGLADAWRAQHTPLRLEAPTDALPIVIGSYNGARRQPNLLPLLALMLQRLGLRVLVHGVEVSTGRTTSAEIFAALGITAASTGGALSVALVTQGLAFAPLAVLSPSLARFLAWRELIGVRHLGHSFVKTLNPFGHRALCLTGITHGPYRELLRGYFADTGEDALLLRGHEGEALASLRRLPPVDWWRAGAMTTLHGYDAAGDEATCAIDAQATANWIRHALEEPRRLPSPLLVQAMHVLVASGLVADAGAACARLRDVLGIDPDSLTR